MDAVSDQPYQLLPALSDEEYAALREDIATNGIRVPVDVDEHGQVLDGHHRQAIAAELGVDCPTRTVAGLTEDDKRAHALAVNLQRRTLSREQRRALIAAELEHDPSRSDRAIGRLVGVDHKTVAVVRRGEIPHEPLTADERAQLTKAEATIATGLAEIDRRADILVRLAGTRFRDALELSRNGETIIGVPVMDADACKDPAVVAAAWSRVSALAQLFVDALPDDQDGD